jgi:hypothetical protein
MRRTAMWRVTAALVLRSRTITSQNEHRRIGH